MREMWREGKRTRERKGGREGEKETTIEGVKQGGRMGEGGREREIQVREMERGGFEEEGRV